MEKFKGFTAEALSRAGVEYQREVSLLALVMVT